MTEELKDQLGNPLAVGDKIATDITSYKRARTQVGTITRIEVIRDRPYLVVNYVTTPRWRNDKPVARSITRGPGDVVRVLVPQ